MKHFESHGVTKILLSATPFSTATICEGTTSPLQCPEGEYLTILAADFGRKDNVVCQAGRYEADAPEVNPAELCESDVTDIVGSW